MIHFHSLRDEIESSLQCLLELNVQCLFEFAYDKEFRKVFRSVAF